jgi:alpha-tubulin suppressor-like RCC1 family protein
VTVTGINTATQISLNLYSVCALLQDGTIKCWGMGEYGVLGNGQSFNSATPVTVTGINTATQISLNGQSVCALLQDGTIKCWGRGKFGQLGNGSYYDYVPYGSPTPQTVTEIPDDGGSPITSYTAIAVEDPSKSCTATAPFGLAEVPTCTITGLTPGQTYTFTVTATNAIGTSIPSSPSAPITIP